MREQLERLVDEALAGNEIFEQTLRHSGLTNKQTRHTRRWHHNQLVVFQNIHDDINRMDTLALRGKTRRNTHRSIISHPEQAQDYYNRHTQGLQTEATRGIDALINYAIRIHDTTEEIVNIEWNADETKERDSIRKFWVKKISEKVLERIGVHAGGNQRVIDLFNGINIYVVIPAVIDKLTPHKKTGAAMSESYIDVLRLIFSKGPVRATYIAAIAKCYERSHNTKTMYADEHQMREKTHINRLTACMGGLEKKMHDRAAYREKKQYYTQEYEQLQEKAQSKGIETLEPGSRIVELYKDFLLANESLKYLANTEDERQSPVNEALRARLLRGIEFLLETVRQEAERHAKMLVVYHTIRRGSRNGNTDLHDVLGAENEIELYNNLEQAADDYLNSERSETAHHERGNTRETLFDGTLYDLSAVEQKRHLHQRDERTRDETYATQTQFHLQDAIVLGKYAGRMLRELREGKDIKLVGGELNRLLNPQ